jgi:hypothetical protein
VRLALREVGRGRPLVGRDAEPVVLDHALGAIDAEGVAGARSVGRSGRDGPDAGGVERARRLAEG